MILDLLKFVLSGPFKFLGFFMILLIVTVLIEEAICNICNVILYTKKMKYGKKIESDDIVLDGKISSSIKSNKE